MSYNVNFTDTTSNKQPITVFDDTSNDSTSLIFPGRNVTGYGQIIAENFLHLLENFAAPTQPEAPVEGQLWYDTNSGILQIFDSEKWKAASGIQKGPTEPAVTTSNIGELWIDTVNQQLRIFTGSRWILVGPSESSIDGLRYGPAVERVFDSDNITRNVIIFYVADVPVAVISKDSFTPKSTIQGFEFIRAGLNVATPANAQESNQFSSIFSGGTLPKLFGIASSSDALNILGTSIEAGKFVRTDAPNQTIEFGINIRNNNGITVGTDGTFNIGTTPTSARLYNSAPGSSLDLQVNRNGIASTILRVIDNRVGINKASPEQALDVDGNILTNGNVIITNTTESTNINNGALRVAGGASITRNLRVGGGLDLTGPSITNDIRPRTTDVNDLGTTSQRWRTVYTETIQADNIIGNLSGNIGGNANTATALREFTTFNIIGDIALRTSTPIKFDGQIEGREKVFDTVITANIIKGKTEPFPNRSKKTDYILTYRASEDTPGSPSRGLYKQTRDIFLGDLGVPIGAIMPFAGTNIPSGYLLCDGSEVEIVRYRDLFDVISDTYSKTRFLADQLVKDQVYTIEIAGTTNWTAIGASSNAVGTVFTALGPGVGTGAAFTTSYIGRGTFRLPDLRGRFPLGRDNMDNGVSVPTASGTFRDSGGGNADRVPDTKADILGADAGQSSVTLEKTNLPEHEHSLRNASGVQFSAVRLDSAISPPATSGSGPTAPGQAQYLTDSGGIKKPTLTFQLGTPVGIMNPYLTINYIIRSGPDALENS
jgi:microcystin-dependent protein